MAENTSPAAPAVAPSPTPAAAAATAPVTQNATANLTPAQLKAQKKAEKAARRGQIVAAKIVPEPVPVPSASNDSSKGTAKQAKSKQDTPATPRKTGPAPPPTAVENPRKKKGPELPETFSYLSIAKKTPLSKADNDVHPAVLAIGQQMANFTLKDNLARLEAMLVALQLVRRSDSKSVQRNMLTAYARSSKISSPKAARLSPAISCPIV